MLPESFLTRLDTSSGCWRWTGGVSHGLPSFYVGQRDGRNVYASARRMAWQDEFGPLAEDQVLVAKCEEARCVKPAHMRVVARDDFDWLGAHVGPHQINASKRVCNGGHPLAGASLKIEPNGARRCRICQRKRQAEYRARKRASRA